jgi:hypothetical protein
MKRDRNAGLYFFRRFKSLEEAIIEANQMSDADLLQVGQIMKIPVNLVTPTATMPSLTPSPEPVIFVILLSSLRD